MRILSIAFALLLAGAGPQDKEKYPDGAKNRLIYEKSPYLRQHADNPVDWYPWGKEAFEKAEKEGKPVFMSIGYSTCHWCHVMERESFMNEEIAKLLKEHYVSVKIDREERPDVDQVYMTAAQLMTGSGGWPLSVWMTPKGEPFYVGTYFPPEDRFGRPGFPRVLTKIAELWKDKREAILADARRLAESIRNSGRAPVGVLDPKLLDSAAAAFEQAYDPEFGGFSKAPKFPRTTVHEFLLRTYKRTGNRKALEMVEHSFRMMRKGGVYDHLGGGFHRYSTDARWHLPHFEKMLYDNAFLARAYAQLHQITRKKEFADTAREILDYVLRDMTSKEGGFTSAEDADSDLPDGKGHAEGAFYIWTPAQVKAVVGDEEGAVLCKALGVVEGGNFELHQPDEPRGNSVVYDARALDDLANELKIPAADLRKTVAEGKRKLFEARARRPRPHLDDKILADWNGLMIGAMAFVGAALEEPRYVAAAERAARFLIVRMRREDGRWLHRSRDGEAGIDAFLDDYACLAEGFLMLHQATFCTEYLQVAVRTAELMIEDFGDKDGGFFHTSRKGEKLIARMKESYDGALPSGNSVATLALLRLADLSSRPAFRKKAEETLKFFAGTIARHEPAYPYHLCALDALTAPSREVVIVGDPEAEGTKAMLREIRRRYLPNTVVALVAPGEDDPALKKLVPMAADRPAVDGKPTAYVCRNYTCKAPTTSVKTLVEQLGEGD